MLRPVGSYQEGSKIITFKKTISIIPYYEPCPHNCWFCIWKGHSLEYTQGPSIEAIDGFLQKYHSLGYKKFSLSGSDVVYENREKYKSWWNKVFHLANEYGMEISVHTKSHIYDQKFLKHFYKIVLSTVKLSDCKEYVNWLINNFDGSIRLSKVITKDDSDIEDYIKFTSLHGVQMTFKQLFGYDDNGNYMNLKQLYDHYDHVVFLDTGDYNIYLMPDDKEHTEFIF